MLKHVIQLPLGMKVLMQVRPIICSPQTCYPKGFSVLLVLSVSFFPLFFSSPIIFLSFTYAHLELSTGAEHHKNLPLWTKQHMLLRCQAIKRCPPGWSLCCRSNNNLRVPPNYRDRFFCNSTSLSSVNRSLDPGVANLRGGPLRWRCTQMILPRCRCRVPRLQLLKAKIPLDKSVSVFLFCVPAVTAVVCTWS